MCSERMTILRLESALVGSCGSLFEGCGKSAALNSAERSHHAHEFTELCLGGWQALVRCSLYQRSPGDRLRQRVRLRDDSNFCNNYQQDLHHRCRGCGHDAERNCTV